MIHLVGKTDNGIVAHGIVDALFLVQLELEMIVCVDVEINASNHAEVEGLARKCRPPVIGDLHMKAH